jgi:hypothetical protein
MVPMSPASDVSVFSMFASEDSRLTLVLSACWSLACWLAWAAAAEADAWACAYC